MPSEVTPPSVKALLPTTTGTFCSRMKALIQFPTVLYNLVSYFFTSTGTFSAQFKTDLCALPCAIGGGTDDGGGTTPPPNANMPAPTNLFASDGAFSDHVHITWTAPTPPSGVAAITQFKLYRALSTVTNPNLASLIASIAAPATSYDDTTAVAGTIYRYWIRATNGIDTSAFSTPDLGSASVPTGDMDAIADLRVWYGFGNVSSSIALVWTPPTGATKYDVWRHTANDFSAATKIYSNKSPQATTDLTHDTSNPVFWDNVGELVLYDTPTSNSTDYYYWVVAKGDSPPSVSDESNVGLGRVLPPAIYNQSSETLDFATQSTVVPVACTKAWIVLQGSGGGGSGGGVDYGGAGGGGGGTVRVALSGLTPGHAVELSTLTVVNSGNAASETDGADGEAIELSINSVLQAIANPGTGGVYSSIGSSDGGDGGDAGASFGTFVVYNGKPGLPNVGANGGRSGYLFGGRRIPMADGSVGGGFTGDGFVGSGAKAVPFNPALSVGGSGLTGSAYITWGT